MSAYVDLLRQKLPAARQQARASGVSIVQTLCQTCSASWGQLVPTAIEVGGVVLLSDTELASARFRADLLSCEQARLLNCAPIDSPGTPDTPSLLLMPDPWDEEALSRIARHMSDTPQPTLAASTEIARLIDTAAIAPPSQAASGTANRHLHTIASSDTSSSSNPVVRFVDRMLCEGWSAGASDIHFETTRNGVQTKLRLDGVLIDAGRFDDVSRSQEVISRLKVLASLDVAETRIPQDGRFRTRFKQREVDFRLSIMPSALGEDAVLRLLDKSHLRGVDERISLESLGFEATIRARMRRLANLPHGMLLVTGPTGSGKTTTLYAVLSEVNTGRDKIITIEDPVEYELPGVLQIPVNDKKGLTFARGLRSILRHDPDRILVGEIRDSETAEIAVQAALTGHQVYTTVHANNAFDVLGRFIHLNVDLFGFASAVNAVVAQRLIRLVCPACAATVSASDPARQTFVELRPDADHSRLKRGTGCAHCRDTGYHGRTAIAELLPFTDALREKIALRAPLTEIKSLAQSLATRSLSDTALDLVQEGLTTIEEVDRVVGLA